MKVEITDQDGLVLMTAGEDIQLPGVSPARPTDPRTDPNAPPVATTGTKDTP